MVWPLAVQTCRSAPFRALLHPHTSGWLALRGTSLRKSRKLKRQKRFEDKTIKITAADHSEQTVSLKSSEGTQA